MWSAAGCCRLIEPPPVGEAARIAGEWLRDNADEFAQDGSLLVEVLDDRRAVLATVAVEANAPTGTMH